MNETKWKEYKLFINFSYFKARMQMQVEGASLALVGHPSSNGVTMKVPYGLDILLHWLASPLIFSYWVG